MALDWQNPNYLINHQFHHHPPFQQQPYFDFQDQEDLSSLLEAELLCFDPLPPTLFEFENPVFTPPPFQQLDFQPPPLYDIDDYLITPPNDYDYDSIFSNVDFPPPMQDILAFDNNNEYELNEEFSIPSQKKQKLSAPLPCFNEFSTPDIFAVPEFNTPDTDPSYQHYHDGGGGGGGGGGYYYGGPNCYNEGSGMNYYSLDEDFNNNINNKVNANSNNPKKEVSPQSKAARERRRKITEKTQELGKLIPGGHKLNTAEMFQAASNYVKFMQAQLGILHSINSLPKDDVKEVKLNNLSILRSPLVQEKLYAKEKCLVPLDVLPGLEEHCDSDTISHEIHEILPLMI